MKLITAVIKNENFIYYIQTMDKYLDFDEYVLDIKRVEFNIFDIERVSAANEWNIENIERNEFNMLFIIWCKKQYISIEIIDYDTNVRILNGFHVISPILNDYELWWYLIDIIKLQNIAILNRNHIIR